MNDEMNVTPEVTEEGMEVAAAPEVEAAPEAAADEEAAA